MRGIAPRPSGRSHNPGRRQRGPPSKAAAGRGHPSVFPRKRESRDGAVGPPLTRTPFPEDTVPATLPSMHSRTDNTQRPPPRRCPGTTPGCFPICTPDSRQGCFLQRKRHETKRIQSAEGGAVREAIPERIAQRCERGRLSAAATGIAPGTPPLAGCESRKNATCSRRALRATVKPPGWYTTISAWYTPRNPASPRPPWTATPERSKLDRVCPMDITSSGRLMTSLKVMRYGPGSRRSRPSSPKGMVAASAKRRAALVSPKDARLGERRNLSQGQVEAVGLQLRRQVDVPLHQRRVRLQHRSDRRPVEAVSNHIADPRMSRQRAMVHGKSPPRRSDESAALEHSGRVTFKAHNRRLLTKSGCSVSGRPPRWRWSLTNQRPQAGGARSLRGDSYSGGWCASSSACIISKASSSKCSECWNAASMRARRGERNSPGSSSRTCWNCRNCW